MWKSLISCGQQATRTTRSLQSVPGLHTPPTPTATNRTFSTVSHLQKAKTSEPQDFNRESLNPQGNEVSKSATDNEIAHHNSAFDPSNTAPESELEAAEKESQKGKNGTLNMSPANQGVSAWRSPTEGGPERNADREKSSAKGSPNKRRHIEVKEDGTHVSYR